MIIVVLRDPRTERPVPDYIQVLWDGIQDHENKIASLQEQQDRMDALMVDYQTAAENAERALGLVPQLADKIDALRDAVAANAGQVPAEVQAAADALDTAAQEALSEAQAALADPPSSAPDAPPPTDPGTPADPGTPPDATDPAAPPADVPDAPAAPPDVPATGPDGGADANADPTVS